MLPIADILIKIVVARGNTSLNNPTNVFDKNAIGIVKFPCIFIGVINSNIPIKEGIINFNSEELSIFNCEFLFILIPLFFIIIQRLLF